jgi:hypothetical protein
MVEDKQVTAVWFLIKELSDKIAFTPGSELALWHAQLYEQALAMEREQIKTAFYNGSFQITESEYEYRKKCANNYYQLTYKLP